MAGLFMDRPCILCYINMAWRTGCRSSTPNGGIQKDGSQSIQIASSWCYFPFVGWKVTHCFYTMKFLLIFLLEH